MFLIIKALIDSNMEFYYMKEEIKNFNNKQTIFKTMVSYCLMCRRKKCRK